MLFCSCFCAILLFIVIIKSTYHTQKILANCIYTLLRAFTIRRCAIPQRHKIKSHIPNCSSILALYGCFAILVAWKHYFLSGYTSTIFAVITAFFYPLFFWLVVRCLAFSVLLKTCVFPNYDALFFFPSMAGRTANDSVEIITREFLPWKTAFNFRKRLFLRMILSRFIIKPCQALLYTANRLIDRFRFILPFLLLSQR